MKTARIIRWRASASLTEDTGIIAFELEGGVTSPASQPLPSARLAAAIAVLESSPGATLTDAGNGNWYVSNDPNAPGVG